MLEQITKKNITKYFFMLGAVVSAMYFWLIVSELVSTNESENWFFPIIVFGVLFIFWALAIILEDKKLKFFLFGTALIFTGLIFSQSSFFILSAVLSAAILYIGTVWVHDSMKARVSLSIWMSLRLGRRLFVAAITIVVIGGLLMPVLMSGGRRTLPLISIGEKQIALVSKTMAIFDSSLDSRELKDMTVNEYILKERSKFENKRNGSTTKSSEFSFSSIEERVILKEGIESVSGLAERNVDGDERIMNIFAEMINIKINNYFNTEVSQASGFAPLFFSALSFFAIFSIGSFVTSLLTFLVAALFKLLVLTNLVELDRKKVEVEVIK